MGFSPDEAEAVMRTAVGSERVAVDEVYET